MRRIAVLLTVALLAATPAAAGEALDAPVVTCIQDNAAKVEAAVTDLNQAVDFLINDVCAEPIADQQARETKRATEQQSEHWKKLCDQMQGDGKKSSEAKTYEALCASVKIGLANEAGNDEEGGGYTLFAGASRPAAAVALASRLLLDLRLSHGKKQP